MADAGAQSAVRPAITVIVVAYHAPEALDRCLESLAGPASLIVIDNSSDDEVKAVVTKYQGRYVDPGSNLGFGAGVNAALQLADNGSDVLLLNPDAELTGQAVQAMTAIMRRLASQRVAALAPRQFDPYGTEQRVRWPWPTPWGAWLEAVGLGRVRRGRRSGFLVGSILLLSRAAVDAVGGFDERFFLYAEETDWQRRAARAGWEFRIATDVRAIHVGAGTSTHRWHREVLFHAGQETYIRKWYGAGGWFAYRSAVLVGSVIRLLPRRTRSAARQRRRLYLAGPRLLASREGLL